MSKPVSSADAIRNRPCSLAIVGQFSRHRRLEVVHQRSAVHGDPARESVNDQVHNQRPQPGAKNVPAESPEDHPLPHARSQNGGDHFAQLAAGANVRERFEKFRKASAAPVRPRKIAHGGSAGALGARLAWNSLKT